MVIPTCYREGYARARELDPFWAELYVRHTSIGDPLADAVVEELAATASPKGVHGIISSALEHPSLADLETLEPEAMRKLVASARRVPDWYDPQVTAAATSAFLRNSDLVMMGLVAGSIIEGFATLISKSFNIRGRLRDNGVRRLKQNMLHLLEQLMPGGLLPGGDGWRLSLRIRLVHAQSRLLLLRSNEWDVATLGMPLSAAHVMLGAAAFSARLMRHVARLGGDFTEAEREAFVGTWRYTSVLLGVPEAIRFADSASAMRAFGIGATCEPAYDHDSVMLANGIINSAPIVLGYTKRRERRSLTRHLYRVSRGLIGEEKADQLRYPASKSISTVTLVRWKNRAQRLLQLLPGSRWPMRRFSQLLEASNLQDLQHSYALPTTLHDEESRPW